MAARVSADDPNALEAEEFEVGGIKVTTVMVDGVRYQKDRKGRLFALPADDDNVDYHEFTNVLEIPEREPGFRYQYFRGDQIQAKVTRGWQLVERDEVGLHAPVLTEYGVAPVAHHQVGDLHLMKKPESVVAAEERTYARHARDVVDSIRVPREEKSAIRDGVEVQERKSRTTGIKEFEPDPEYPSADKTK